MSDRKATTRRDALTALGASASAFAVAGLVRVHARANASATSVAPTTAQTPDLPKPDPEALATAASREAALELLGDVRVGTVLSRCRVVEVLPVQMGGIALRMETPDGASFQLDVLRDDAGNGGVGRAPGLAVHVSNRGDGKTPTDETQGLSAMALGDALARRIREGATVPTLLTFREREARFPGGRFTV
jgi:hypothetical protein